MWCIGVGIRSQFLAGSPQSDAARHQRPAANPELIALDMEVNRPGIENPAWHDPQDTRIRKSLNVIGIVVHGHAYAYSIPALSVPTSAASFAELCSFTQRHVVNHLLGDTAVSVTYCDVARSVRVLKAEHQSASLPLGVAGASRGQIVLSYDGTWYRQDSANLPLADHAYEVTYWGDWVSRHPTSRIYLGPDDIK